MSHEAPTFPLPESVLAAFPPDRMALFDWLRARVTDEMLEVISRCDYGQEVKEHFSALRHIRDTGDTEAAGDWIPGEVLGLYRWSEFKPEIPRGPLSFLCRQVRCAQELNDPRDFHIARGFCACALLVGAEQEEHDNLEPFNVSSLLASLLSCRELGQEPLNYMARMITHGLTQLRSFDPEFLFYGCALLANLQWMGEPTREAKTWFVSASREILPWHRHPVFGNRVPGNFVEIWNATVERGAWTRIAREVGLVD